MAKAHLTLPNGTTVLLEGEPHEIANLLDKFSGQTNNITQSKKNSKKRSGKKTKTAPTRKGPRLLIQELENEGWFKSKRTIGEVQKKLEEKGHIYAMSHLSPPLLRLTRSKVLRRLKEKEGWVYVS